LSLVPDVRAGIVFGVRLPPSPASPSQVRVRLDPCRPDWCGPPSSPWTDAPNAAR
jgi:hypothetical protein